MALPPQPIGQSESFMSLMDRVSDVASLERPVLIAGERGTGKELIANRLHFLSPRWERTFVAVNCAAFTPEELDRELFGRSFLDGRDDTNGRFFEANNGTLFLDAVHTLPIYLQEKLMHVIENGSVQATGEIYEETVDVRVVAATSVDLQDGVEKGLFRADLLDRLAFHVISLPPLRARRDDIPTLIQHFGRRAVTDLGAESFPGFTAEAQETLISHRYVGNIRELKMLVERSTVHAYLRDETLSEPIAELIMDPFESEHPLPPMEAPSSSPAFVSETKSTGLSGGRTFEDSDVSDPDTDSPVLDAPIDQGFKDRVLAFERRLIDEAMRACKDHQGQAAERLDLTYHQFRGLLRKHGLKN